MTPAGISQQELESRLWAAANSLRGPVDPSDFKAYIFQREADGTLDSMRVLPDPRKGALTQIFHEYAPDERPEIIERVVEQIDDIVRPVRGSGWQSSFPGDREVRRQLRLALSRNGLPATGELYDRAYAYIRENY